MKRFCSTLVVFVILFLAFGAVGFAADVAFFSDAPDETAREPKRFINAPSYAAAMRLWKTPEDIAAWAGENFSYDMARAKRFAAPADGTSLARHIFTPEQLFTKPSGICVDLARFGVESLRELIPDAGVQYLRIEFEPVIINSVTLRIHWLALFRRDGKYYFFADSKRPGHLSGPYESIPAFIAAYETYRQRAIVSFQNLDTFQRQQKKQMQRRRGSTAPS